MHRPQLHLLHRSRGRCPDRAELAIRSAEASLRVRGRRRRREIKQHLRELSTALRHETVSECGELDVTWYAPVAPLVPIADGCDCGPEARMRLLAGGEVLAEFDERVALGLLCVGRLASRVEHPPPVDEEPVLELHEQLL